MADATDTGAVQRPTHVYGSPAYTWYAVGVMMLVYTAHAMDRGLPAILVEPIRAEFNLKDSQIGLITGLSYGAAFAAAILPMGWISDRVNRRNFLGIIVILWSLCTAMGGFARNFWHLFAARVGVGIAESGAAPVAMPMLSDIFPAEKRAFPLGIFYMSANFGTFLASALGGWVAAEYGWRAAFLVVGFPGVLVAILLLTTVREPRRGGMEPNHDASEPAPPLLSVLAWLARTPAMLLLIAAATMTALVSITMGAWMGSFFIRVHHLSLAQVGLILGIGGGLCGAFSPAISGWLSDRLAPRDPRWTLRIVWMSLALAFAFGALMLFSPVVWVGIAAFVVADFFKSGYAPLTYAVMISHTPVRMRGVVMSIVQMMSVLTGFGLGPVVVGAMSDYYGGGVAIRYAIFNAIALLLLVVILMIVGSRLLYGPRRAAN